MEIEQDWFMRQIHQMAQLLAHVVFQKDSPNYEIVDEMNQSQADLLYSKIKSLVADMKICEAEDLLFGALDTSDKSHLLLAFDFYQTINMLSDEELEHANFSRAEIRTGLQEILERFNLPDFGF